MNHGHKTTAMWLTKKLCVFTSHYWKSFSNLHYVICRQTGRRTDTPLWVLSRRSYNHGHHRMTLHFTHFPFLILFWEITLQGLNLPPLLLSRGGMWCVCVCVHMRACMHMCACQWLEEEGQDTDSVNSTSGNKYTFSESLFYCCYHNSAVLW